MWNRLVLTAGSDAQKQAFHEQIFDIPTGKFTEAVEIVTDEAPEGVRIGSGGATLGIIRRILDDVKDRDNLKVLLIHSGGLSQRMPHQSAYGKVFGMMPNGKTLLETKLEIYKDDLLAELPPIGGIMISASDVLEDMGLLRKLTGSMESHPDITIFVHRSSLEVGTQHGVFVMNKSTESSRETLKKVLQKPTIEEMHREEAVDVFGTVLTDSCYFMTWQFCERLLENNLLREPVTEELCCYGDFMRPMGTEPKLDYIQSTSPKLTAYRKALADAFKTATIQISNLGNDSFFHFGTYQELIDHLHPQSTFRRSLRRLFKSNVINSPCFSTQNVPETSFVEFSTGQFVEVGSRCVISGIAAEDLKLKIPDGTVIFTMALKSKKFVSIMFKIDEDIKKKSDRVRWNGYDTGIERKSLWNAPLFGVFETRIKSVEATMNEWTKGLSNIVRVIRERPINEDEISVDGASIDQ